MISTADDLIGTRVPSYAQAEMVAQSIRSWDYYWLRAYPRHAFGPQTWDPRRGPVPTCLPYGKTLITQSAEFVFRSGAPRFSLSPDKSALDANIAPADALLQRIIEQNRLAEIWVTLAETLGNQGALAVKWSVDQGDARCPVRITFLSIPQECRLWFDPMDWRRPLMARVQFPYRDYSDGKWYYYREEWTEDRHVTYEPLLAGTQDVSGVNGLSGYEQHLGDIGLNDNENWVVREKGENPFGVLPFAVIANRLVKGNPFGEGDIWQVTQLIDRLALTMHGEDKANQLHSDPIQVAINADVDNDEPIRSGETISIKNAVGEEGAPPADFKLVEPSGAARPHVRAYADKLEALLYEAVGVSRVNPETVSNKGNLSSLVLRLLYERTISTSDRKRQMWGESGLCPFFTNLLTGLNRMGGFAEAVALPEDAAVGCQWPDYFAPTDTDKMAITERTVEQVDEDLLTHELGIERIARVENLPDSEVEALKKALIAQKAAKAALTPAVPPADAALKADTSQFSEVEHQAPKEREI